VNDSSTTSGETERPPSTSEPARTPPPEQSDLLILPGKFFFVERIEVPTALEAGELDDFAELSMEGLAPFPLEQIHWGFLCSPDRQSLIIYAALKERLKRAGYEGLEAYTWVLPDFACLYGARFGEPVDVLLHSPGQTTRLEFPAGEDLPLFVETATGAPGAGTEERTEAPARLELRLMPPKVDEKARPTFYFEMIGEAVLEGHWSPLSPAETALWRADIRPGSFKAAERSARRATALVTRLLRYAALFALVLVFLEGLLWAGQLWRGTLESKIAAQATAVRRVEDKQSLTNKLEQVAQNELRPVAILEAANQIRLNLGDTGIEYDETIIEGSNRITIEGKANTINELNAYTDSLKDSGTFSLVGSPRQITRSGKTTFTVTLDYQSPEPNPEPGEPDDTAPDADSTE
jgi:hypothetical protein